MWSAGEGPERRVRDMTGSRGQQGVGQKKKKKKKKKKQKNWRVALDGDS